MRGAEPVYLGAQIGLGIQPGPGHPGMLRDSLEGDRLAPSIQGA